MESSTNSAQQSSDVSKGVIIDDILKHEYADAVLLTKVNETPRVDSAADTESINSEKPIVASSTRNMASRGQRIVRWLRSRLTDRCIYGLKGFAFGLVGCILCQLPKSAGYECGSNRATPAFYFDSTIRQCIKYIFLGCGGNPNRFITKRQCEEGCQSMTKCDKGLPLMDFAGNIKRCDRHMMPCVDGYECIGKGMQSVCCRRAERICVLPVDRGTMCGIASMTRYYFDNNANLCRPFSFVGCGGNENNFETKGHCLRFCANSVTCLKGEPLSDRYSTNRIMTCNLQSSCPKNYTCTGLNDKKACCPSKGYVCGMPYDPTIACRISPLTQLWTFNKRRGLCELVDKPACANQLNTFASLDQCIEFCIGRCSDNNEVHLNPLSTQPQLCDSKQKYGCSIGFECIGSTEYASICCKTQPVCPSAESLALFEAHISEPIRCNPKELGACPEGYTCQQAKNLESICCTPPLECPFGMRALREQFGRPHICSFGIEGTCPTDHICTRSISNPSRFLCCRPQLRCVIPFIDTSTQKTLQCYPGENKCRPLTNCLAAVQGSENVRIAHYLKFYCCHQVDIFTCADGRMPMMDSSGKKPLRCNSSNPGVCPQEYDCEELIDGTSACCSNPVINELNCTEAILFNGVPRRCVGWDDNSCNSGKCRRASNSKYYCCKAESL